MKLAWYYKSSVLEFKEKDGSGQETSITGIGEVVEKLGPPCTVAGNVKLCRPCERRMVIFQNTYMYGLASWLLSVYTKALKMGAWRDIGTTCS